MKKIKFFAALLALVMFLAACNSSDDDAKPQDADYLIFGHFYGECMGEQCIEIFKLESDALFEDDHDIYPNSQDFYDGNFTELPQSVFDEVDGLVDDFPVGLLDESEKVIGMPDAGDWGGLYIEYKNGDIHDFWLLDQMKSNVPADYHDFIDKANEKIQMINN